MENRTFTFFASILSVFAPLSFILLSFLTQGIKTSFWNKSWLTYWIGGSELEFRTSIESQAKEHPNPNSGALAEEEWNDSCHFIFPYADANSDRLEYYTFLRNSRKDQIHEDYGSGVRIFS